MDPMLMGAARESEAEEISISAATADFISGIVAPDAEL
jgi:hypothetical protein